MVIKKRSRDIELSVIIPAYNEELSIERCVRETVSCLSKNKVNYEMIVVNDGSKDNTEQRCRNLLKRYKFKLVNHDKNKGYTEAIKTGIRESHGKYLSYLDADLQFRPIDMISMYKHASKNNLPFVTGITASKQYGLLRKLITDSYYLLVYLIFRVRLKNTASLKVIRADFLRKIKITSLAWLIDLELIVKAKKLGCKIDRFNILVDKRGQGKTTVNLKNTIESLVGLVKLKFEK